MEGAKRYGTEGDKKPTEGHQKGREVENKEKNKGVFHLLVIFHLRLHPVINIFHELMSNFCLRPYT